ncbi:MAG: hypothetical protein HQ581_08960, partial [Planctomycetes bacterium]|nr:hypothetical protein [Planctomycetota bacterium]
MTASKPPSGDGHPNLQPASERNAELIDIALRVTFLIVGPVPVMLLALLVGVVVELTTELIFRDSSYYQEHGWCLFVGFMSMGVVCFSVRRVRHFGSGIWIGPLLIAMGVYA